MTVVELLAYLIGGGGVLATAIAALWKERLTKRDYHLLQEQRAAEMLVKDGDVKSLLDEIRRLNEERHKLALRRGTDTAFALEAATRALDESTRCLRENTATITRLETKHE
jgi:hypothetical protein